MIEMENSVVILIHMHLVMIKCSSAVFQPYTHDHRQVKANIQRLLYLARTETLNLLALKLE